MQSPVEVTDSLGRIVNDGTIDLPTLHRGLIINWRQNPGKFYLVQMYYPETGEIISETRDSASKVIVSPNRTRLLTDRDVRVRIVDERTREEVGSANFRISPSNVTVQELRMQAPTSLSPQPLTVFGPDGRPIENGKVTVSEMAQGITLRWPRTQAFSYLLDLESQRNGRTTVPIKEGAADPVFRVKMSPDTLQILVQGFRSVYSMENATKVASARLEVIPDPVAIAPTEAALFLRLAGLQISDGDVVPAVYTRSLPSFTTEFADKNSVLTLVLARPSSDGTGYQQIYSLAVNIGNGRSGTVVRPWSFPGILPGTTLQVVGDLYLQQDFFPAEVIPYLGIPGDLSALAGNLLRRVFRLQFTVQG